MRDMVTDLGQELSPPPHSLLGLVLLCASFIRPLELLVRDRLISQ